VLILAGLGNPGAGYARNRHNVGFMAADEIARRHSFSSWRKKFRAEVAEGRLAGRKTLLLKPQTFMNLSGEAIGEAMRFHKVAPADLVVVYDEIDLPAGKLRIKTGGGAGGHNGIRSIDAHVGKDYRRVRLGIGHPGEKSRVSGHVLGDFAKSDGEWLGPFLAAIAEHAPLLAKGEDSTFMNKVALAIAPAKSAESGAAPAKGQSHIRQARPKPAPDLPQSGPMAAMLKRLFGKD